MKKMFTFRAKKKPLQTRAVDALLIDLHFELMALKINSPVPQRELQQSLLKRNLMLANRINPACYETREGPGYSFFIRENYAQMTINGNIAEARLSPGTILESCFALTPAQRLFGIDMQMKILEKWCKKMVSENNKEGSE